MSLVLLAALLLGGVGYLGWRTSYLTVSVPTTSPGLSVEAFTEQQGAHTLRQTAKGPYVSAPLGLFVDVDVIATGVNTTGRCRTSVWPFVGGTCVVQLQDAHAHRVESDAPPVHSPLSAPSSAPQTQWTQIVSETTRTMVGGAVQSKGASPAERARDAMDQFSSNLGLASSTIRLRTLSTNDRYTAAAYDVVVDGTPVDRAFAGVVLIGDTAVQFATSARTRFPTSALPQRTSVEQATELAVAYVEALHPGETIRVLTATTTLQLEERGGREVLLPVGKIGLLVTKRAPYDIRVDLTTARVIAAYSPRPRSGRSHRAARRRRARVVAPRLELGGEPLEYRGPKLEPLSRARIEDLDGRFEQATTKGYFARPDEGTVFVHLSSPSVHVPGAMYPASRVGRSHRYAIADYAWAINVFSHGEHTLQYYAGIFPQAVNGEWRFIGVRLPGVANAFMSSRTSTTVWLKFGDGGSGGLDFADAPEVIAHEIGHGFLDLIGQGRSDAIEYTNGPARLHEAYADYVAASVYGPNILAVDRHLDESVTAPPGPCLDDNGCAHEGSLVASSMLWSLRSAFPSKRRAAADRVVADAFAMFPMPASLTGLCLNLVFADAASGRRPPSRAPHFAQIRKLCAARGVTLPAFDTEGPSITIRSPAPQSSEAATCDGRSLPIRAFVHDPNAGFEVIGSPSCRQLTATRMRLDDADLDYCATRAKGGGYHLNAKSRVPLRSSATYRIDVVARDAHGNETNEASTFDVVDVTGPTLGQPKLECRRDGRRAECYCGVDQVRLTVRISDCGSKVLFDSAKGVLNGGEISLVAHPTLANRVRSSWLDDWCGKASLSVSAMNSDGAATSETYQVWISEEPPKPLPPIFKLVGGIFVVVLLLGSASVVSKS